MTRTILLIIVTVTFQSIGFGQRGAYIRVFDLNGKKFEKGHLVGLSDSSITLVKSGKEIRIPIDKVGLLKTKKAFGNAVLTGSIVGGGVGAVLGVIADGEDGLFDLGSTGEWAAAGAFSGAMYGALVGTVIGAVIKRTVIEIDGNAARWQEQKHLLERTPVSSPKLE